MQYKVKIITRTFGPVCRETETVFTTPDVLAPSTKEVQHMFEEATAQRFAVGVVEERPIVMNGFGQLFLVMGDGEEKLLGKNVPQTIGSLDFTAELVREPWKRKDNRNLLLRLWHWLIGARCHNCFYFDQQSAVEWRDRVTHTFQEGLVARMWDDVTKISAEQAYVPDIPKDDFGYCAKQTNGLSGCLPACRYYKRMLKTKKKTADNTVLRRYS